MKQCQPDDKFFSDGGVGLFLGSLMENFKSVVHLRSWEYVNLSHDYSLPRRRMLRRTLTMNKLIIQQTNLPACSTFHFSYRILHKLCVRCSKKSSTYKLPLTFTACSFYCFAMQWSFLVTDLLLTFHQISIKTGQYRKRRQWNPVVEMRERCTGIVPTISGTDNRDLRLPDTNATHQSEDDPKLYPPPPCAFKFQLWCAISWWNYDASFY